MPVNERERNISGFSFDLKAIRIQNPSMHLVCNKILTTGLPEWRNKYTSPRLSVG